jgi:carbon monoxide dehydrogenase subunit G
VKIQRTVETTAPLSAVYAYLSDFTTTNEWDPGTVETTRVSGDGGPGTVYRNVSSFAGRKTELSYTVTDRETDRLFALRGENKTVVARDTMEFAATPTGTRVTYTADFDFKGLAKFVVPFMAPAFKKLGDEAEEGLKKTLAGLPAH